MNTHEEGRRDIQEAEIMKLRRLIDFMITDRLILTIRYWDNYHFVEKDFTPDEAVEKFADALVLSFYAKAENHIWMRLCN